MIYISIDPGQTNTGMAMFDATGKLVYSGKHNGVDAFLDFLEMTVDTCFLNGDEVTFIVEQFRSRPGNARKMAWSTNQTSQHIGAITRYARKNKITVHMQEPSPALVIGLKFLGLGDKYKGKHVPDEISAAAHGEYWLRKNGVKNG